jgi:hypothetical protein
VLPPEIDDKSIGGELLDRPVDVAGHVHAKVSREHADSDDARGILQLRGVDDFVRGSFT